MVKAPTVVSLCIAFSASACASSTSLGNAQGSVQISDPQGISSTMTNTTFRTATKSTANVPIATAWKNVQAAYAKLGIPLTALRETDHYVGNEGIHPTNHRFAGRPLSQLLECGSGSGGPNADVYSVTMSVVTLLTPNSDGSTQVATMVQGSAVPQQFGAAAVMCGTTGALEQEIGSLASSLSIGTN